MRTRTNIAVASAVAAVSMAWSTPAFAATTVGNWQMGEAAGATVMDDWSSYNNDGVIGSGVKSGVAFGTDTGYEFTSPGETVDGNDTPLVLVKDSSSLDPGSRNMQITVEVVTTDADANLLQKGQAGTYGGHYKVEINAGKPACQFRGSVRERLTTWHTKINDGKPHTIVCTKLGDRSRISVDGATAITHWGGVGTISNAKKLSIGGKWECNGTTVDCDYYTGLMGRALITFD